jgi:uncharacterized protein YgfB (UPF0149 family)
MQVPALGETTRIYSGEPNQVEDIDLSTAMQRMTEVRQNLRCDLSVLEATKETAEASLRAFKFAEREVRGMGLRAASLSAEQSPEELTDISQLQAQTNGASRQLEQHLKEICRWVDSIKALIICLEAQVPTAER